MTRRRHLREGGWSVAEAMAALALISLGLTASFAILVRVRSLSARLESADDAIAAAERIMERTLALPSREIASRTVPLARAEAGGRPDWRAEVRVAEPGPYLVSIEVTVVGDGQRASLSAVKVREELFDEANVAALRR